MGSNQSSDATASATTNNDEPPKSVIPRATSSPSLHKNMLRHVKNRDPFSIYEVTEVLGVGSMGSVSKVRKRRGTIGGSARPHIRSSRFDINPITGTCSSVPIVGGLFRVCCGRRYRRKGSNRAGQGSIVSSQSDGDNINVSTRSSPSQTSESGLSESNHTISSRSGNILFSAFGRRENLFAPRGGATSTDRLSGSLHVRRDEKYEINLALKSIHLARVSDEAFVNELKNEIELLRSLDHPHIVRPIEVFEYRHQLYFTMEALSGGDLYSRDPYTESEAARVITAILSAIAYMHSKNIIHRDLKYEAS